MAAMITSIKLERTGSRISGLFDSLNSFSLVCLEDAATAVDSLLV